MIRFDHDDDLILTVHLEEQGEPEPMDWEYTVKVVNKLRETFNANEPTEKVIVPLERA